MSQAFIVFRVNYEVKGFKGIICDSIRISCLAQAYTGHVTNTKQFEEKYAIGIPVQS
jgi:hypothetical protein